MWALALAMLAAICAAAPIAIVVVFDIWAPVAIIWETFGVHYTALPTLLLGYHFIGNAMGFAEIYAFAPSLAVHYLSDAAAPDRMQAYLIGVYAIHAALVLAASVHVVRMVQPAAAAALLIAITAIWPLWVGFGYSNILSVNYFWLPPVLYMMAGAMALKAIEGHLEVTPRLCAGSAALCALAIWTKVSYVATVCPFLALPLLLGTWRRPLKALAAGVAVFAFALAALIWVYFVGRIDFVWPFLADMQARYSVEFITAGDRSLLVTWPEGGNVLHQASLLVLLAIGLVLISGNRRARLFASAVLVGFLVTVAALVARPHTNTAMDALAFCGFAIGTMAALLWASGAKLGSAACGVTAAGVLAWQLLWVQDLPSWVDRLQEASRTVRPLHEAIEASPTPVVYYFSGAGNIWSGPPLWPSPYLYALVSGLQPSKQPYLRKYFPGRTVRALQDGPAPFAHTAVIQEYAGSGELTMKVSGSYPAFDRILKGKCRRFEVQTAWTDYVATVPTVVSVCRATNAETKSAGGAPAFDQSAR